MSNFKGREIYSLDKKGRVNIPAKMRKCISPDANGTFNVTRGVDMCISAYPLDEWKKIEDQLGGLNQFDKKSKYVLRVLLEWSEDVSIDAQQRITLPKDLLALAGIEGKVKIVGQMDHIEFWNPERYEEYLSSREESYDDVLEKVMTM